MAGLIHVQLEGCRVLDCIRWETDKDYIHNEVFQLTALLTMWDHYLSIYLSKESTEGDDLNQEKVFDSGFLDVMIRCFVGVINSIHDKIPIAQFMSEC